MCCCEKFEKQSKKYKKNILGNKECFAVEASVSLGWHKYVKDGNFIGMKSFGASAPYKNLYKFFNITSVKVSKLIINKMKNEN